ncbi:MAG: ATP-binding protein [Planctomycetaceae bacterium]
MDPLTDEIRTLRRCVRDVVALSALSAAWGRTEPQDIAESLTDVLLNTLDVDFAYVRLKDLDERIAHEAARTHLGLEPASRTQEIGTSLGPLLKFGGSDPPPTIDNPVGRGRVQLAIIPIGYEGDCGILVVASPRPDFPTQADRLVLGLGANQAAVVLQHKRAERALRQSHLRYRMVARAANDAIWDWDLVTNQVTWNEGVQALFGYTAEQVGPDAAWWRERIHPEDRERVVHDIQAVIASGKELWGDEYRHLRADGSYAYVIDRGFVVYDDRGKPLRMVGSLLDLTERRRLEESLREADRRKGEFIAMLAHELRNPLAPIRNALHLLERAETDGSTSREVRAMMRRQVDHMTRLVDDLLDISRIAQGKIELRKEVNDLATIVRRSVEASRPLIEDRGHVLTVSLPPEAIPLEADPTRLKQILDNLLTNAAKYTDPGGRIELAVDREGGEVVIRVRDTGIGIAPEKLPRIFDLFVQAERRLDRALGGLGIGLSLVRSLVELHGWSITAHSDGPGRGSEFAVRLPAPPPPEGASDRGDSGVERRAIRPLPRRRILVVDDNLDSARTMALMLRRSWGQEVEVAHDGAAAVEAAGTFGPEVILLDIGLPGMSGYDVARRLRERPEFAATVIVAMTGWGQDEDRRRSREAGIDHHLVKPVDPDSLQRLLSEIGTSRGV